jgi:TonB family protein
MEFNPIPPVGESLERRRTYILQSSSHNFALSVQRAIGPKQLSGYGQEGSVLVAFSVGLDGALTALRIARSSGVERLDSAALQIVGRAAFPVPPTGLSVINRTYVSSFAFT